MADRRPVGCAAGFVNVPRIKGVHNAMGSAMLAAEHAAAALAVGRANDELSEYEDAWRTSSVGVDLHKVRNVKPLLSKCGTVIGVGLGFIDMWTNTLFGFSLFGTLAMRGSTAATLDPAKAHVPCGAAEGRRQTHFRQAILGLSVEHQSRRGSADPPESGGYEAAKDIRARYFCRAIQPLLPCRGV
jgi:hypothetical protein